MKHAISTHLRVPSKSVFEFNKINFLFGNQMLIICKLMTKNCMWPLPNHYETWHYLPFFDRINTGKHSQKTEGPSELPQAKEVQLGEECN